MPDSLKKDLSSAHTDREKVYALTELASYYSGLDDKVSKSYGDQAMEVAEMSRDRLLIAQTWIRAGNRYFNRASLANSMTQAMECFQHAEKIARDNDLEDELGFSYIGMARVTRGRGD